MIFIQFVTLLLVKHANGMTWPCSHIHSKSIIISSIITTFLIIKLKDSDFASTIFLSEKKWKNLYQKYINPRLTTNSGWNNLTYYYLNITIAQYKVYQMLYHHLISNHDIIFHLLIYSPLFFTDELVLWSALALALCMTLVLHHHAKYFGTCVFTPYILLLLMLC